MTDYNRLTHIAALPGLTPNEYRILQTLAGCAKRLSRAQLMEELSLSDSSVRNALRTLVRRGHVAVSESSQIKYYAWPEENNTLLTGSEPTPPPADDPATMKMTQLQDAVIDAWCRGAGMSRAPQSVRGPLYDMAASLGIAVQKGAYTLDDITRCTHDKVRDNYNRTRPNTWTLAAISRELHGWKALQQRKKTRIDPPPDFKSGLDPKTGLYRLWNRKTGTEELVALAPLPEHHHEESPNPLAGRCDETGLPTRFQKDFGRESYSMHHYMTPREEQQA